ncbi:MAG: sugar ABC transporter permease [Clostridiales bacterium]|jgi:raffinose/stachyose/melibiose transport system permease protein|nr:sugar ABC transporter permease [Clostridiales bacterium]
MSQKRKGVLQSYLMLLPNLALFLVISVYPVIWALQYMLFEFNGIGEKRFVGVENFIRLFTRDPNYWNSVRNTFVYAGGKILLIIPLAFLVAVLINNPKRLYGGVQAVVFSPTIMSSAVMSLVFYLLFNVYNGEINRMLSDAGLINAPINWLGREYAMITVILVAVWGGLGNYMVYFLAGLQQIDTSIYESAEIDGVTYWQKMRYITIPMLGSVLKTILMLAIINGFYDYQSIMVLTEGGPFGATEVMFLNLYKLYYPSADAYTFRPQYGYGAAVSVITALIVGGTTLIYLRLSKKLDEIY